MASWIWTSRDCMNQKGKNAPSLGRPPAVSLIQRCSWLIWRLFWHRFQRALYNKVPQCKLLPGRNRTSGLEQKQSPSLRSSLAISVQAWISWVMLPERGGPWSQVREDKTESVRKRKTQERNNTLFSHHFFFPNVVSISISKSSLLLF